MFEAMLAGWRLQQESRLLAAPTVDSRDKTLRRFQAFTGEFPWRWGPADIEEWSVSLRSAGRSRTTIRGLSERGGDVLRVRVRRPLRLGGGVRGAVRGAPGRRSATSGTPPTTSPTTRATRRGGRSPARSCRRSSTTPTSGWRPPGAQAARAGWRRGGTRRCSRSSTRGVCAGGRRRCWTRPTSPPTRRRRSSAASGCCRCATARRCGAARRGGATWPR